MHHWMGMDFCSAVTKDVDSIVASGVNSGATIKHTAAAVFFFLFFFLACKNVEQELCQRCHHFRREPAHAIDTVPPIPVWLRRLQGTLLGERGAAALRRERRWQTNAGAQGVLSRPVEAPAPTEPRAPVYFYLFFPVASRNRPLPI